MDKELLKLAYKDLKLHLPSYQVKYDYYRGKTKAISRLKEIDSDLSVKSNILNYNMVKKFIKEEIAYSLSNGVTYQRLTDEADDMIADIAYHTAHWSKKHNTELLKRALIFNEAYELYYIDKNGDMSSRILTPLNCYIYEDDFGNVEFAMHKYSKKFDEEVYFDVYTKGGIHHYKSEDFTDAGFSTHIFGEVPISVCRLSIPSDDDTIYDDIGKIQDAYSINLSNISSEITEYRLAYLKVKGGMIEEEDIPKLKELGVLMGDFEDISFLTKNINDTFVANTLDRLKEDMYEVTGHINTNEKLQSNISGVALRSRLISLENRCKLNQQTMHDCMNNRLRILFNYLRIKYNKNYDWRTLDIRFTLSIPSDDYLIAQIASLLGDRVSDATILEQLSFILNGDLERDKADSEKESKMIDFDKIPNELMERFGLDEEYTEVVGG